MECLIQYLDEIEDFMYAIALSAERIRRVLHAAVIVMLASATTTCGVMLALYRPPLAMAVVVLALAGLLYHAVVGNPPRSATR